MPVPSARRSRTPLASLSGIFLPLALVASTPAPSPAQAPWIEVAPSSDAETSLRELVERGASLDTEGLVSRVEALSASHPDSPESGLARLFAGWKLLAREEPAAEQFTHPDIGKTAVAEQAWLGLARERLRNREYAEAAVLFERVVDALKSSSTGCAALAAGAEARGQAGQFELARDALTLALARCPRDQPRTLPRLAENLEKLGDLAAAARTYDRLARDHPVSSEADTAAARLAELSHLLPARSPAERAERALRKARAQLRIGRSAGAIRTLASFRNDGPHRDDVRVLIGRAEIARRRYKTAAAILGTVPSTSSVGAPAAFQLAVARAGLGEALEAYEEIAERYRGTPWGERALFSLGNHFQKDALDERALPYYRRVLDEYREGDYFIRATWRVGWGDFRAEEWAAAAARFEHAATRRPEEPATGIFLYWAARAHLQLGAVGRATRLLQGAVTRFKHTYHGLKAAELLQTLGEPARSPRPLAVHSASLPQPSLTRYRQFVLIGMLDEAREELARLRNSRSVEATRARIDFLRGDFSSAIRAMSRAYPEYLSERGASLPQGVWTSLFPLPFADALVGRARRAGVDPALVAALIRQESAFDTAAVSSVGARGLMQIMPATGRSLARSLGLPYRTSRLHDAETNLRMGIRYVRDLLRRFDGRVDHALAAYNAGPHRVDQWKARYPDLTTEEFVETIPFTQTRLYVRKVLANRQLYRRLYPASAGSGEEISDP